jgi:hypothetical protein
VLSGVYSIVCKSTDRGYVGSSINVPSRWKKHLYFLRKGNHVNPLLQSSYNKYGEESFEFRIIDDLSGLTKPEIREIEQVYLDLMDWKMSFNVCKDSRGGEVTEEANERRKESLKNFHRENPDAIRGENNPFYGRTHDQSAKDAVSLANTGLTRSEEFKQQKSEFMSSRRGRHHTEEHKENLREKYKGGNNPAAVSVMVSGVTYGSKKEAIVALGLKNWYQLDKLLNAERLSREGVGSSDPKRVSPSEEG